MVVKKYNITYIVNGKSYKINVLIDDSIQITDEKSKLHINTSDANDALEFINELEIAFELKQDLAKFIDNALIKDQHDRINLLLIEMENSLEYADEKFEQKYLELRNRFNNMTQEINHDIESFEEFEDEIDQS